MEERAARILNPGILSTVQDLGREGRRRYGVPSSGALDSISLLRVNSLLSNSMDAPSIEVFGGNICLEFALETEVAVSGAEVQVYLNGEPLGAELFNVKRGEQLQLGIPTSGFVNYIGIKGGFWGEYVLGSRSTYMPGGFGGSWGRALNLGDEIPKLEMTSGRFDYGRVSLEFSKSFEFIPGIHLNQEIEEWLVRNSFEIEASSDRMGYRLRPSVALPERSYREIVSMPVFPGMMELTKEGEILVVMKDGQTTGGYPMVGMLEEAELCRLVQLGPGGELKFSHAT